MADRISTLPDAVLCHILSFLKTKQAVATSTLSKRWKHLWLSVPVLDFSTIRLNDQEANFHFNDFVYSVLLSRDPTLPIKSFRLKVMYTFSRQNNRCISSFVKWINFVLQRGVEYLDLCMSGWPILPNTIFNCTTLVVLKLHLFRVDPVFSSVLLLPSLKTLHIELTIFPKHEDFMSLLAECPNLEDLLISNLWFRDEEEDSQSCNKWKNLSLSNLTKANVDSTYFHFPLKALHNVQSLSMCILTAQVHDDAIPTFHNLTRLNLYALKYRWHFLVEVLKLCPKLQELDLDQAGMNIDDLTCTKKDDKENWVDPDFVPQCLLLHLRTCYLRSFLGLQGELQLARYIFKNARVLRTMRIWAIGSAEIEGLLSSCPRTSSSCRLSFHHTPRDFPSESDSSMDASESSMGSND